MLNALFWIGVGILISAWAHRKTARITARRFREAEAMASVWSRCRNQFQLQILGVQTTAIERLNVPILLLQESGIPIPPELMALHLEALDEIERAPLPDLSDLPFEVADATMELKAQIREFREGICELYESATEPESFTSH